MPKQKKLWLSLILGLVSIFCFGGYRVYQQREIKKYNEHHQIPEYKSVSTGNGQDLVYVHIDEGIYVAQIEKETGRPVLQIKFYRDSRDTKAYRLEINPEGQTSTYVESANGIKKCDQFGYLCTESTGPEVSNKFARWHQGALKKNWRTGTFPATYKDEIQTDSSTKVEVCIGNYGACVSARFPAPNTPTAFAADIGPLAKIYMMDRLAQTLPYQGI